jgi:hypothetical protein
MATIAKAAPAVAYNAAIPVASFRYKNWRVILNGSEILIKDIEKPADADEVVQYLRNIVEER